jgi:hypothetical protein
MWLSKWFTGINRIQIIDTILIVSNIDMEEYE